MSNAVLVFRLSALYLFVRVLLFLVVAENILTGEALFSFDSALGTALSIQPYDMHHEALLASVFLMWGVFLWRSTYDMSRHTLFLEYSGIGFVALGCMFFAITHIPDSHVSHHLRDGLAFTIFGLLQLYMLSKLKA